MTKDKAYCTNKRCSYLAKFGERYFGRLHYHHEKEQICPNCFDKFVFATKRASQCRPTRSKTRKLISEAVALLASRITALESENSALRLALDGRARAGVLPYSRTKTEVAKEMLMAGAKPEAVASRLGWDVKQVQKVKYRLKNGRTPRG